MKKKIIPFLFLLLVGGCVAPQPAYASPYHFDTEDYICVATRWDPVYSREYCSEYEARRPAVVYHAPARVVQPTYIHQYRQGVSVNIQSRYWNLQYRDQPVFHNPPRHRYRHPPRYHGHR